MDLGSTKLRLSPRGTLSGWFERETKGSQPAIFRGSVSLAHPTRRASRHPGDMSLLLEIPEHRVPKAAPAACRGSGLFGMKATDLFVQPSAKLNRANKRIPRTVKLRVFLRTGIPYQRLSQLKGLFVGTYYSMCFGRTGTHII